MRSSLLLLLAAVSLANADFITIRSQPMWQTSGQPGTLYVVNSQSSQDSLAPRLLGLLSSFQLQPPSFQQSDAAAQAFSSFFSDRAGSFLDSSLSSWIDRQVSALDSLQDGMASSAASLPAQRPGCPRMAAMRAAQAAQAAGQATLDQDALSYLAASRFGPGFMATVTQDFDDSFNDDDDDAAAYAEDVDMSDDWQLTGPDVGEDALEFITDYDAAGGMGDFTAAAQQQEPVLATAGGTGYGMPLSAPGSRGFQPSLLSEEDNVPGYWVAGQQQQGRVVELAPGQEVNGGHDHPVWFFVLEDGSLNWGFIVFLLLTAAVVPVWVCILRSLAMLFRHGSARNQGNACAGCPFSRFMRARVQARQEGQFMSSARSPLLAEYLVPLAPEKPCAETAAPELFVPVEVASEHATAGKDEYVTIAYVPLKDEV